MKISETFKSILAQKFWLALWGVFRTIIITRGCHQITRLFSNPLVKPVDGYVENMTPSKHNLIIKKNLDEMTEAEWESLCDHCGLCCLQKIEDQDTAKVQYIGIACEFLDIEACQCLVYENRHFANPDCIALTRDNVRQIKWLPETCAYRRLAEGRQLEWWHPLVSGDPDTVHQAGISVRGKAISGQGLSSRVEDIDVDV